MNLSEIKDPSFLKKMSIKELNLLADEIRSFLIETVSKTGGHISSNLGVVEITIALHYAFNAPIDKILFDVGHQAYVHKILTGRAAKMHTLRQFKGISGFQKMRESEYDCFDAGHSSTALAAGLGFAVARDLNKENYHVVTLVGDASLSNGLSLEALNQIGYEKKKLIIVFNDNNMSISKNVGALSKEFANMRNSSAYNNLKNNIKTLLKDNKNGQDVIDFLHNFKNSIKKSVIDAGVFKEFDIDYIGPIDGHNIHDLIKAFEVAKQKERPCVIHCVTTKGKGYEYAEEDEIGSWHGVGKFNISSGKLITSTPEGYKTYSKIVADCVEDLMAHNRDIVTITPAMIAGSELSSIFAHYPHRAFDVGIAEDYALTFASGLALNHKRPFVSIYSSFLQRAYDQVNHDIARNNLPVVIGIDRASLVGEDGETHQGIFDISFLRPIPNIVIAQGKDAKEIKNLIYTAFKTGCPFCLRYPKGSLPCDNNYNYEYLDVGKWEKVVNNDSRECYILTYGNDVQQIENIINTNNLPYELINCRYLKPIDEEMLKEICKSNKPLFVYTSDILKGGLGDEILEFMAINNFKSPIYIFGIDDIYVEQGTIKQLKEELKIDIVSLFDFIKKVLNA